MLFICIADSCSVSCRMFLLPQQGHLFCGQQESADAEWSRALLIDLLAGDGTFADGLCSWPLSKFCREW